MKKAPYIVSGTISFNFVMEVLATDTSNAMDEVAALDPSAIPYNKSDADVVVQEAYRSGNREAPK